MAYDILVVDDEPGLREMVQGILAGAGYTVRLAGTCAQALQQSRAKLPDGVLLDVMLPDGDGFALLGQLRDWPICRSLPLCERRGRRPAPGPGPGGG